jgi:hypothetical protein
MVLEASTSRRKGHYSVAHESLQGTTIDKEPCTDDRGDHTIHLEYG